ncbi:MAG TPA: hypothetical protein VFG52_01465 [Xanthomonadales bacterium]|nr:hypothetical protein [Xanthomonadales bacterium]
MTTKRSGQFAWLTSILLIASSGSLYAGVWKPLCPVGSSCHAPYQITLGGGAGGYSPLDPAAAGPLVTSRGIQLFHTPVNYGNPNELRHDIFRWSSSSLEDFSDNATGGSDLNALELADGRILAIGLYSLAIWDEPQDVRVVNDWSGYGVVGLNNAAITLPPVELEDAVYVGIRHGGGQTIHASFDKGETWTSKSTDFRIGDDRYNLLTSPEQNALWAISSEFFENPGRLWESVDHGDNWTQVDDGSFPANTVRVVHDPVDTQVSYALTDHGLFVSLNRGVSWQATALTEAVHGLVFVDRGELLARAMVAGIDRGISISVDDGENWSDLSSGLFEGPHTITYAHGQLLATGDEGYFTCNGLDCDGLAMPIPPEEAVGMVEVTEYYNTILGHYFMTGAEGEKAIIDQGNAGAGWERTGESFLGWSLRSNPHASNVCRFYGSHVLGPNSHFYSDTALECHFLMELQEDVPDDKPRWNFEGWAMAVLPRAENDEQPCPENAVPVYRAYNNGYALGKDSNHRYVTNRALLSDMEEDGWIDEGIAFCAPNE